MAAAQGAINLKPNKPEAFDGRRDYLVVNTWLYKIEQYLSLVQLSHPTVPLTESNRILYASTFLTGTAAVWRYTLVQANTVPETWPQFKAKVIAEFVPDDHVRRARDRLRKLHQTSSVSKYLSEFRNIIFTIPGMNDGEMWDKFCSGLKYEVRLEVMKSTVTSFEEAAKIALPVDSAIWGVSSQVGGSGGDAAGAAQAPTPMEIGNFEDRGRSRKMEGQRLKDYRNNAYFTYHKVGCRPWKHQKGAAANNFEVAGEDDSEEHKNDSENWTVLLNKDTPEGLVKRVREKQTGVDGSVTVAELILLDGYLNSAPVHILKDDGCNTNVVSKTFLAGHSDLFRVKDTPTLLSHSKKDSNEEASQVIVDAELRIGRHTYRSNFVVADCRYDVLLGMPWHKRVSLRIDYVTPVVYVENQYLPVSRGEEDPVVVTSLGVKKFRSMVRKKGNRDDFQVFHLMQRPRKKRGSPRSEDAELQDLLSRFEPVFKKDLPPGTSPETFS